MARLLFRDSQGREGTVELSPAETVYVGRGLECAIRTDDGMVSRRHSQIRMEGGRYVVEDLGSANGTHLNNTRIQKQALGHADVVQCGSLTIRFDDANAVNVVQQALPQAGPPPPAKKGGTMVLDRGAEAPPLPSGPGPGFGQPASPYGANSAAAGFPPPSPAPPPGAMPYGGPPGIPGGGGTGIGMKGPSSMPPSGNSMFGGSRPGFGGSAGGASGFGGPPIPGASPGAFGAPPAMPGTPGPGGNLPYGGPPAMPHGGVPGTPGATNGPPAMPGAPNLPYGGPPSMPGSNPSIFGRGGISSPVAPIPGAPIPGNRDPVENKVLVDLGLEHDPKKADGEIRALRQDLDKANAGFEREVADGKRVRAEAATLRERIEELRAQVKDREEQVAAHDRVADELRDELQQTRDELSKQRNEMGELAENMAARERQAARAVEDTAKLREDMEDVNRQLMELSRTKDEGWKKLNEQLTEIEHLREVINEQERMLEERRVGLISQEEVIKELRADKEKYLKLNAQLKAERDEAATTASRTSAQIVALEEENRRLGRLLVEAQTDSSRGGTGNVDHMLRLTNELKETRVELKKAESDRERLTEQYELAERDRVKLENRMAQIEVELQETSHGKLMAESARNVAQDALAKAEVARHRSAEEALNASKARDVASTGGDDARRELDRMRRKIAELEKASTTPGAPALDPKELQHERESSERKIREANDKAIAAERSLKALQAEVDAAKTDAAKARAEAARARAAADSHSVSVIETGSTQAITRAAGEVYDAINDILSEMRNNMVLVKDELPNLKGNAGTMQAVSEAVEALVDNAETAKGALRGLRDLAESK
jgi:hypothetical protein